MINTVRADLTEMRSSDEQFDGVYAEAMNLCETSGIEVHASGHSASAVSQFRKSKIPAKFADSCVIE